MYVGVYVIDPIQRDEMVLAILRVGSGQFDAARTFHVIDGADVAAICGKNFHMLADFIFRNHFCFLRCFIELREGNRNAGVSFPLFMTKNGKLTRYAF
jgi:hypothetical protein